MRTPKSLNCYECGKPKGPGQGRRYCDRCREKRKMRAKYKRREHARLKRYAEARKAKTRERAEHWKRYGRKCQKCGELRPCPEQIGLHANSKVCVLCQKAATRERQREWARWKREVDPEFRRRQTEATMLWRANHPERQREYVRRYWAGVYADPERLARRQEDNRMRYRLRQERNGRAPQPISERRYMTTYGRGQVSERVAAAPLIPHLRSGVARLGEDRLSLLAHVSSDSITAVLDGESIALFTADRLCTALGLPFSLVYEDAA